VPIPVTNIAGFFRGATWGENGAIVFSASNRTGLIRVSDAGGVAQPLTTPTGEVHMRPHFLPGGRTVLFHIVAPGKRPQISALNLDTGNVRLLLEGEDPRVTQQGISGLSARRGSVGGPIRRASRGGRGRTLRDDRWVARRSVRRCRQRHADLHTTPRCARTAKPRVGGSPRRRTPDQRPNRAYVYPRISPDGTQFAIDIRDQQNDIWIWHTVRRTMSRLTFNLHCSTVFPCGRQMANSSLTRPKALAFLARRPTEAEWLSGSSTHRLLFKLFKARITRFHPAFLPTDLACCFGGNTTSDMHAVHIASKKSSPVMETPFNERNPELSPNGRWVAYESNESGRFELHVRPFDDVNSGRWQVSTDGGLQPLWARNSRELFFRAPSGAVMQVVIGSEQNFSPAAPIRLFEGPYFVSATAVVGRTYDVSLDGQQFLMIKDSRPRNQNEHVIAVENAFADLNQSR
jgi:eukaryotic-like serine/threonine-protein kinase